MTPDMLKQIERQAKTHVIARGDVLNLIHTVRRCQLAYAGMVAAHDKSMAATKVARRASEVYAKTLEEVVENQKEAVRLRNALINKQCVTILRLSREKKYCKKCYAAPAESCIDGCRGRQGGTNE